jgi:membrane dipeptidase
MGFIRPEQLIEVADLMVKQGYPENAVRGVLGENWLRVCRGVWK